MIVPGSFFELIGAPINHPFSWYALVEETVDGKTPGKRWTYWFNGNQLDREAVAAHIRSHYRNVKVVTIDTCTSMPTRALQPVPAHHHQFKTAIQEVEPIIHPRARIGRSRIGASRLSRV